MNEPLQVLHLDDDAGERKALEQLVAERRLGWVISSAADAAQARALLAEGKCEVIVTELPAAGGADAELFSDRAAIGERAVLVVTGRGDEAAAARALRAGVADYVVKQPGHAHLSELVARVEGAAAARRAERKRQETAAKLGDLFDGTSEIIQSVDPAGRLEYVNRRWRETFGFGENELAGLNLFDLIHPAERPHCGELFQRLMAGEDVGEFETRFVTRDGRTIMLSGRATVRFEGGRPVATRTVLRDVTAQHRRDELERRRRERVLRLQTNLLQLREQSDTDLASYLRLLTGSTLASVGLEVSAVWMLSPCGSRLECRSRHRSGHEAAGPAAHAGATDLAALTGRETGEFPLAVDRLSDSPALAALAGGELITAGTAGVIVAPVVLEGRPAGCVLFSHSESGRKWEPEEVRFGAAAAACVVLALERERRRRAEEVNRKLQQDLERLVAERTNALAESELRFRQLAENIGEVFYTIDLSGGLFLYISPAFSKVWGRPADQAWTTTAAWLETVHEEDRAAAEEFAARRAGGPAELEYRIRRPDGAIRRIHDRSFPVRDAAGAIYRATGLAVDVTESRNAEAGRVQRQRLEAIGNLAGGIAHDLNNTLTPITLGLQLLRRKHPDEEAVYGRLLQSAAHGSNVVRQLLTFARGAGGERVPVRSADVIENLAALVGATFPRDIRLQTRCAPDTWTVVGDTNQLQQVLLNLCVNSRDAMPEGGSIEIEARNLVVDAAYAAGAPAASPGRHVVWSVQDSGCGIPESAVSQIFEPFFTTKGPQLGTGLGLSTVAGIVREHGGFVTVSSEPGRGACFRVHLPAAGTDGESEISPVPAVRTHPAAGEGRLLLVVDDEAAVLEALCASLQEMGYRTSAASDGTDALIRAAENRAVLCGMVTDLHMSGIDGLKLIRTVRHMLPTLPVIVVTGRLESTRQRELAQAGVGEVILKPFTEEQLAAALERALTPPPEPPGKAAPAS